MFTPGLEQVVHAIAPSARPSGCAVFPANLPDGGVRRHNQESAHAWLSRCCNDHFDGSTVSFAVEENLALFLLVRWRERRIDYANVQALWVDAPIAKFLKEGGKQHRYLRLDYDTATLGPLLKEPLPHVHVEADGAPRFPIPLSAHEDVIGWFLDFVYRNFFYDDWIDWVERTWSAWCLERGRENPWPRLIEVFKQSATGVIVADERLQGAIAELKQCIAQKKRDQPFFRIGANPAHCPLLSHEAGLL